MVVNEDSPESLDRFMSMDVNIDPSETPFGGISMDEISEESP